LADPLPEKISVDGLVFSREQTNTDLRGGIIKSAGDPGFLAVKYVGDADDARVAVDRVNGAGEDPGMTPPDRPVSIFLEIYLQHRMAIEFGRWLFLILDFRLPVEIQEGRGTVLEWCWVF
jgi:hypothetical protein